MRDKARERVIARFTFPVFSKQLDEVLKRMAGGKVDPKED
jgi:hypothetical protein